MKRDKNLFFDIESGAAFQFRSLVFSKELDNPLHILGEAGL